MCVYGFMRVCVRVSECASEWVCECVSTRVSCSNFLPVEPCSPFTSSSFTPSEQTKTNNPPPSPTTTPHLHSLCIQTRQLLQLGFTSWWEQMWNRWDFLMYALYVISVVLRFSPYESALGVCVVVPSNSHTCTHTHAHTHAHTHTTVVAFT